MRKGIDRIFIGRAIDNALEGIDGGKGSGNFGHGGRPGQIGGSGEGKGAETGSKGAKVASAQSEIKKYKNANLKNASAENISELFPKASESTRNWLSNVIQRRQLTAKGYTTATLENKLKSLIKGGELTPVQAAAAEAMLQQSSFAEPVVAKYEGMNSSPEYQRAVAKYSLGERASGNPGNTWKANGGKISVLPKGSGTLKISEGDVQKGEHSINGYLNADGSISQERLALHDEAIAKVFGGKKDLMPKPGEPPVLYFLGGGSASGKGSFTNGDKGCLERFGVPSNKDCPTLDADEFKKELPEYSTQLDDDDFAAGFAHEESSALVKRGLEAAYANGTNVTLDGTGDGSVKGVLKKIAQARQDPNRVIEARYCTASMEKALENAAKRAAETKRKIDEDVIIGIHESVSEIFPQVASEFDHCVLYDNEDYSGTPIAECVRGGKIKVLDKTKYDAFLKKAYYSGNLNKPENTARKAAFEAAVKNNHEY